MGAPSEISPKLFDVEIMIGCREGAVEVAIPGGVVLIVLHEFALSAKVPALHFWRVVLVLVQVLHLAESLGKVWVFRFETWALKNSWCIWINNQGFSRCGINYNGIAIIFIETHSAIKEAKDDIGLCGCVKQNSDPISSVKEKWLSQIGFWMLKQNLLSAL